MFKGRWHNAIALTSTTLNSHSAGQGTNMAVVILEGEITELSNSCVINGTITNYEFIKIGNQRVRKVRAENYLDTFIQTGAVVRLACVKSRGIHVVMAAQESTGEISQLGISLPIQMTIMMLLCSLLIGAVVGGIAGIVSASVSVGVVVFGVVLFGLPWLVCADSFKARTALNGMKAPTAPAAAA